MSSLKNLVFRLFFIPGGINPVVVNVEHIVGLQDFPRFISVHGQDFFRRHSPAPQRRLQDFGSVFRAG